MVLIELIEYGLEFLENPLPILARVIQNYGIYVYLFLFLIVFFETGLIIMPFLPGDSLLFCVGMIASGTEGEIKIRYIVPLLICAALLGDNLNYFAGKKFGNYVQSKKKIFLLKKEHITKAEKYFNKSRGKTLIFSRFIPILRTITPFIAGAGKMKYRTYLFHCIIGAIIWVTSVSLLGYFLGDNDWVKKNFTKVILGIFFLSIIPFFLKFITNKKMSC